jgi:hypothetical protein
VAAIFRSTSIGRTYFLSNLCADTEPGEPLLGGLMTKTVWAGFRATKSQRLVIHTFGSSIDTVLAAYRGTAFRNFRLLRGNDNTPVPGFANTWSLISIDVARGADYRIQIGGRRNAAGDISLTLTSFPPGGGVSAFLADAGGNPSYSNRAYACTYLPCLTATFVLHNSTTRTVVVSPTVNVADVFDLPPPVTMKPGAVALVRFTGKTGLSNPAGGRFSEVIFRFPAKSGAKTIASADSRGHLFLSDPAGSSDKLTLTIDDRLKVGNLNQEIPFIVRLRNTGTDTARKCHFRPNLLPYILSAFQRIDPATGRAIGAVNQTADIPPKQTHVFKLTVAAQMPRRADLEFGLNSQLIAGCANRYTGAATLLNTFDLNASDTNLFTDVATVLAPKRTVLTVPKGGTATFDVIATNGKRSLPLLARARYVSPFAEYKPNNQYTVSACRLTPKGRCVEPAGVAKWTPRPGEKARFRVFVKAPAVDPGFDPAKYRVFLTILGVEDDWPNVFGSSDVAVRRK